MYTSHHINNELTPSNLGISSEKFIGVVKYLFDDPEEIEEVYVDRDECRMKYLAHVDIETAKDCVNLRLLSCLSEHLVGDWMLQVSRTDREGICWFEVDKLIRVEKVTETVVVTKWKPVDAPYL